MYKWTDLEGKMISLSEYADNLGANITFVMKDLFDKNEITEVAEGLKEKFGSFVSENGGFHGFAIARTLYCSDIDDVLQSDELFYGHFSTISNFTYKNFGHFFSCNQLVPSRILSIFVFFFLFLFCFTLLFDCQLGGFYGFIFE
ncbi:hypothetical protein CAEBREN_21688 [Caenorhabditis brenneri]|uniref:Uncharacterized protein n=1 Tax=Caenorhabditis brenneri TaxID=135651 RepID=G0N2E7_CAEBE|nr:hypothetical protein CAEBREN_21688 [Caenorhabditis brenneri]